MYEIKVLEDKEFDDIAKSDKRYSYVDHTNLGFADRQTGRAYVRQTGVHDLNKYLISHELEELEQDDSTHEDPNGIRHKKGGFFKNFYDPLGLFHAGNILGIGGKAGLGSLFGGRVGDAAKGALVGSVGGPAGAAAGALGGLLQSKDSQLGPLNQFNTGGGGSYAQNLPQGATPNVDGGGLLSHGLGAQGLGQQQQQPIDNEVLQKLRGNYSGRISF